MGANIAFMGDQGGGHLRIDGPTPLGGAFLQSCDDHRIAMMFLVAAQVANRDEKAVEIDDLSSISVSFPDFISVFQRLSPELS
jgi:3-phosphoshikimate 1-carboxyvinyltransferase